MFLSLWGSQGNLYYHSIEKLCFNFIGAIDISILWVPSL